MATYIGDNVETGLRDSKAFVAEKFAQAKELSNASWTSAQAFLNALSQLVVSITLPTADVGIDDVDTTLDMPPASSRPEAPPDSDFDVPDFPLPVLGTLLPMPITVYPTDSLDTIQTKLLAMLLQKLTDGGTGLDATVEQAIWDRAIARQELENQRAYEEAEDYFAARGFTMPPGALMSRLQELNIEIARNNANLNNDILTQQSKLAQDNMRFLLSEGANTVFSTEKLHIDKVLNYNKNTLEVYLGELEAYRSQLQLFVSRIEAILKVYLGKVEAYKADAQVMGIEIDSKAKVIGIRLDQAKIKADLYLKEIEVEIEKARLQYGLQVETIKAGAQISAQVVASALSSVNAHASMGFSSGANEAVNANEHWDMTKRIEEGTRKIEERRWDMTE